MSWVAMLGFALTRPGRISGLAFVKAASVYSVQCTAGASSTLVVTPVNDAVREGSGVTLQCSSDVSNSVIHWYDSLCVTSTDIAQCTDDFIYNGYGLVSAPSSFSVTEGSNASHVTRDLNINPTQLTDAGLYLCAEQVPGVAGVTDSSAQLIVLGNYSLWPIRLK